MITIWVNHMIKVHIMNNLKIKSLTKQCKTLVIMGLTKVSYS